jgi:hypothetical protein
MQLQSIITKPELEPDMAKSEVIHCANGQELELETIKCLICREYA